MYKNNYSKSSIKVLTSCMLLFLVCHCSAQFNMKVGYNGNFSNLEKTNEIFELYNQSLTSVEKELKPIRYFQGIEIGGRYKFWDYFGVDLGIAFATGDKSAEGIQSAGLEKYNRELKINMNHYYVGLENYFGFFGYGGTIGYQKLKYKDEISTNSTQNVLIDQSVLNSRFYLIFESVSNSAAFSLRPFVSINWQPYNIQNLETALLPDSTRPASEFDENNMVFGVSILIYNGPQ